VTSPTSQHLPGWAIPLEPACAAIAALLHPHAEVALHDLATDTIIALWNGFSGRTAGEPSLLSELPESWQERPVQGPYAKVGADGAQLSSVSAVINDEHGTARGLLCVNLDRTPLLDLAGILSRIAAPAEPAPPELFQNDWREQIAITVEEHCRELGIDRRRLSRTQRAALVSDLDRRGLFATRNAAHHAAKALNVSRATIYALLKEVRGEHEPAAVPA
jgi:D-arginine utilization repressor